MRPNILAGAICLIGAAALAACQPSQSFEAEPAQPNADVQQAAPKTIAAKVQPKKTAAKPIPAAAASNAVATDAARAQKRRPMCRPPQSTASSQKRARHPRRKASAAGWAVRSASWHGHPTRVFPQLSH